MTTFQTATPTSSQPCLRSSFMGPCGSFRMIVWSGARSRTAPAAPGRRVPARAGPSAVRGRLERELPGGPPAGRGLVDVEVELLHVELALEAGEILEGPVEQVVG